MPTATTCIDDLLALFDEAFIDQAYLTLLGRTADASGKRSHLEQLRAGCTKESLIAAFAQSTEGRERASSIPGLAELCSRVNAQAASSRGAVDRWIARRIHRNGLVTVGTVAETENRLGRASQSLAADMAARQAWLQTELQELSEGVQGLQEATQRRDEALRESLVVHRAAHESCAQNLSQQIVSLSTETAIQLMDVRKDSERIDQRIDMLNASLTALTADFRQQEQASAVLFGRLCQLGQSLDGVIERFDTVLTRLAASSSERLDAGSNRAGQLEARIDGLTHLLDRLQRSLTQLHPEPLTQVEQTEAIDRMRQRLNARPSAR